MKWISYLSSTLISTSTFATTSTDLFDHYAKSSQRTLSILSYNIKGLPAIIGPSHDRFREIGKILKQRRQTGSQPDIVLLQEAFVKRVSELNAEAGYPYVAKGPESKDVSFDGSTRDVMLNSGLYILSDHPIIYSDKVSYGGLCKSWDCKANKGAQLAIIRHKDSGEEFAIYNTHLQASEEHSQIRIQQMTVLREFIEKNRQDMTTFYIGDFNSNPKRKCYAHWLDISDTVNAGQSCLDNPQECTIPATTDKRMLVLDSKDQHFVDSRSKNIKVLKAERNFTEKFKGKSLSDHLGYEVVYQY